mgnify:CR=1 FL=1
MAKCSYCNTTILFGGVTEGNLRFCNAGCHEKGQLARVAQRLPRSEVRAVLDEVHQGRCPECKGKVPVDVHVKHTVWSAVYLTSWNSKPMICCRSCGVKAQAGGLAFSAVLGWWGFPWGLIMTPVQIIRNISGMMSGPNPDEPSAELDRIVRLGIAAGDFGDISGSSGRRKRHSEDDDDDAADDDDYDDVEVVTKPKVRKATAAPAPEADNSRVSCPNCEASFKAAASIRGKRVKCPKCGGAIDVPE